MTEKKAFEFGYDAAKNGPNTTNCQFLIFCDPEFTKAWERGYDEAKRSEIVPVN